MSREKLDTHQKALQFNLDPGKYGTFAEIGAGQEVARWFFRVGGAAGTVAKSTSAYDMTFSDAIYGPCQRYVSRQRLETMLAYEYDLLLERLQEKRGGTTTFFAFADTVAARSYTRKDDTHGWLGIRFQTEPQAQPSQVVIHVRLGDKENVQQQEALGIIGVNLIFGAFYAAREPEAFLESLLDNLTTDRLEVDMVKFSGVAFESVDHRLMSLKLVQLGLTNAAMFAPDGEILQPSEVLYKKPILVERGSFRPVTWVNLDMLDCARSQFVQEPQVQGEEIVALMEITMRNLLATGAIDYQDFLARADVLAACGQTVLISNYAEYFRLAAYLSRYTRKMIGITMGVPSLIELFDEKYYEHLDGGILESFGRLFKGALKLYVYPLKDKKTGELKTVQKLKVAPHLQHLYTHLVENRCLESIDFYNKDYLPIFSRDVLAKIRCHDAAWEKMVPPPVAAKIKLRGYFGYSEGPAAAADLPKERFASVPMEGLSGELVLVHSL